MQPTTPPPAQPIAAPKLSSTALYAIAAISVAVIAAIFGFILVYVTGLDAQLWWIGLCSLIFAFLFYMVFAATHNKTVARTLAGAFFVIGVGSYYGSIAAGSGDPGNKLFWMVFLSILVVIVLTTIFMMARQGERDAIRKSQRRITP